MKRILIASLALAFGLHIATAQLNRVLNLEGAPYEVPFLDFSTNGVWLGATGFSSSHFSPRGVKIWNLLTGDTYLIPADSEYWVTPLRFVPATSDLTILVPEEHLTVYRPFSFYTQTRWQPLARFFVSAYWFDVAPNFAAAAFVDSVGRVLILRGLTLETLNGEPYNYWNKFIAFSPDGALLATAGRRASGDNEVQLVRVSDLSVVRRFTVPFSIEGFAYAPNGRYIAVVGWEGQLRLWDLQTNQFWDSMASAAPVHSIRFSSDSALLATGENDGFVRVWRTPHLTPHTAIRTGYIPAHLAFHPTENTLFTTGIDGAIDEWRIDSAQRERIFARRWTPQGFRTGAREFWVSDMDLTYAFNEQGQLAQQVPIGVGSSFARGALAFSPDKQWVVFSDGVRRVSDQQPVLDRQIASALFSRDSRRMVAQNGFVVGVYDTANWQLLWETNDGGFPEFSADGARLLLYRSLLQPFAQVVDTDTAQPIWSAPAGLTVLQALIAPNGRLVAIVYSDNAARTRLRVYDIDANTIVLETPPLPVSRLAFSPNSRYLIASLGDGNSYTGYDLQTGQVAWEEEYGAMPRFSTENFAPDSRYLVLPNLLGYPVIVDVATGSPVREWSSRPFRLISATYSDDGTRLALQYADTTVEIVRHIPVEGDANDDGCVDDADLLEVLFQFGQTSYGLSGDLNRDNRVDDADLLIVLFNFGSGC